ncbi:hypothetical protein HWV62_3036 [Athelia sp. TMB]|nr:hypothetical protein HWV62_3036 [Athelia sp. TMB]
MASKHSGFNAEQHAAHLLTLTNYANRPGFVQSVGWDREENADVLVDRKSKKLTVLIVVGKASANKMWCGPLGNFAAETTYGEFNKAKFQFTLSRPDEPVLAREYEKALKIMALLQRDIAKTAKLEYFIVNEGLDMRFGQPLFERRSVPLTSVPKFSPKGNYTVDGAVLLETLYSTTPPLDALESDASSGTMEDDDVSDMLDDTTRNYAKYIPSGTQKKYYDLMKDFAVTPFRLFKPSGQWIKPDSAEAFMQTALVECHFSLKHFWIRNAAVPYDTFSASLEQVIWLKPGMPRAVDGGYGKRTHLDMSPTPAPVAKKAFKSTSGSSASSSPASRIDMGKSKVAVDSPLSPVLPATEGGATAPPSSIPPVSPLTSGGDSSGAALGIDSDTITTGHANIAGMPVASLPVTVTPVQAIASIDHPSILSVAQLPVSSDTIVRPAAAIPNPSSDLGTSNRTATTSIALTEAQLLAANIEQTLQPEASPTASVQPDESDLTSDEQSNTAGATSVSLPSVKKDKKSATERKVSAIDHF